MQREASIPQFDVAHLHEQGQDLIIIPLDSAFGYKNGTEQSAIRVQLQSCASAAGLAGTVVPVWDGGGGRMAFLAPHNWVAYFQGLTLQIVAANINCRLTCG